MVERRSASLLDTASNFLSAQESEKKRRELGKQFVDRAEKLIRDFGPVKYRSYGNYTFPYLEPGTSSTPPFALKTPDGEISMHVEGQFKKDSRRNIRPDSVRLQSLTLRLKGDGESDGLTIEFDNKGNPYPGLLPSSENLQRGLGLLQRIKDGYEERGFKVNSHGYSSDDHP